MKKKLLLIIIIFNISIMFADPTATAPASGDGSVGNPYQIATVENLFWLTQNSSEWGKNFIQTADIDASSSSTWSSGSGFTPIGLQGTYDGNGHSITGVFISRSSTSYIGFFGYAPGAVIKNVGLINVNITNLSSTGYVAALAGGNAGTITNCYSTGSVTGASPYASGLVGYNSGTISNCYSTCSVSGANYAGGLQGYNAGTITNCYSTGFVSGTNYPGGLVGYNSSTVSNSFWDISTSGRTTGIGLGTNTGATGKTTADMKTMSTFTNAGWDFETVWQIYGTNYPDLRNNSNPALPVELATFSASISNLNVELVWETATEVNNYGFEILRSAQNDNHSGLAVGTEKDTDEEAWEKVAFVQGYGNSNSPKYYSFTDKSIQASGKYYYRLKQIDIDGTFEYSDIIEAEIGIPKNYELKQNYPNPFNPSTTINYSIPNDAHVTLAIYDALGKEVALLDNGFRTAGNYSHTFDASNLSSGMYFYTINAGNFSSTKKMLLMK